MNYLKISFLLQRCFRVWGYKLCVIHELLIPLIVNLAYNFSPYFISFLLSFCNSSYNFKPILSFSSCYIFTLIFGTLVPVFKFDSCSFMCFIFTFDFWNYISSFWLNSNSSTYFTFRPNSKASNLIFNTIALGIKISKKHWSLLLH
jgi:hypothetical protein